MSIAWPLVEDSSLEPKRSKLEVRPVLSFFDEDKVETVQPHDDALVVTLRIGGYNVKRVLVDQGSNAKIMYPDLYKGLKLKLKVLACYDSPLVGFDGKVVIPMGQIGLPVKAGLEVVKVDFIVVNAYSPYTAIVARPWLLAMGAVSSTLHLKVKYPFRDQVEELVGNQSMVGAQLSPQKKEELIVFLRENIDVFVWSAYEAPRVVLNFIFHHLNVNPAVIPKKQPLRRSSKEHSDVVKEEIIKLKQAGAIKEVFHPKWLANTAVVEKKSEK
ncbi:uncharacterized protein LOC142612282 [Castanea sativa]|uniref:uncharacterized protein LOC142612282 n=1 Tax=Castanea sativa TaxID=21020 RepID=UPI003F64CD06